MKRITSLQELLHFCNILSRPFLSREAFDVNTLCNSSMASGEVAVSFVASSQTHSVQPIMTILCQTVSLAIVQISFFKLSFHVFYNFSKLKWQDFVITSQQRLMYYVFSMRESKSHSTSKRSRDRSNCFVVIFFSLDFLNAFQSDNNSNRVYVLGHKHVLSHSQNSF